MLLTTLLVQIAFRIVTGAFMAIGASSKSAGMFSNRKGVGRARGSRDNGSTTGAERTSSIEAALRWFKRHQSPNGMWDVDQYQANCQENGLKCEPGVSQPGDADIACTA